MDNTLYDMIFKRKSFHLFRNIGNEKISPDELKAIEEKFNSFIPLVSDIKVRMKIVEDCTSCKRGQEYCIYLYSETKDNYLQNIGYIGEQLDLYLVSQNIGTLWYGLGKTEEQQWDGLDFVIMIAIAKVDSADKFLKDMFKSKRKDIAEIWSGAVYPDIANIVRFAPSACNTQPWVVEAADDSLTVYRSSKPGRQGIMPADKVSFYNRIDIGIFLCFLELCLGKSKLSFERTVFIEDHGQSGKAPTAKYLLR